MNSTGIGPTKLYFATFNTLRAEHVLQTEHATKQKNGLTDKHGYIECNQEIR